MEGPPKKKRRFFEETSEVSNATFAHEASLPDEVNALSSSPRQNHEDQHDDNPHHTQSGPTGLAHTDTTLSGFDQAIFESIVCEKVAPDVMNWLREASGDNMERAVNMYFDGSWRKSILSTASSRNNSNSHTLTIDDFARATPGGDARQSPPSRVKSPKIQLRDSMPAYRYVGAFGVDGWATRSGTTLIKYGETVCVERQKIQPSKAPVKGKGRPATVQQVPKANSAASKRVDVIVRFTNGRYVLQIYELVAQGPTG